MPAEPARLRFRRATPADVPALHRLVERAYRGEPGPGTWTSEAHLVGGARTSAEALTATVTAAGSHVVTAWLGDRLVGCCHVQARPGARAYLGLLAVDPELHGRGLGRAVIAEGERVARDEVRAREVEMTVIHLRHELLAWYERLGYRRRGTAPFPYETLRPGDARRDDLAFVVLAKPLTDPGGAPMTDDASAARRVPEHLGTVTPRLVVPDAARAVAFYAEAFGAEERGPRYRGPAGEVVHTEIRIGDSTVMLTDDADPDAPAHAPAAVGGTTTVVLATYWPDVDAVWERAVAAGAEVVFPLADQYYGERGGRLRDPFGHQWMLSTRLEDLSPEEVERRATHG